MNRLCTFYINFVEDPACPQGYAGLAIHSVREFVSQLGEYVYDLEMQLKRASLALRVAKDRKEILNQHLTAQNAAKQEAYTQIMWRQQHKTGLDAVVMKVITAVTLIYLPMTFVSTFFSTGVVSYGPDSRSEAAGTDVGDVEQVSRLALGRFFIISIPLMVLIFVLAWGWHRWESHRIIKKEREDRVKLHV